MSKKLRNQILKFGVVGGIAFLIDYAVLFVCEEFLKLGVLWSAGIAFTISEKVTVVINSVIVFDVNKENDSKKNFIIFIVLSIVGLILTEVIMWIGTDLIHINYLIVKIVATAIVMVFNFVTRKMFLE